jgi:SAM-dependent methyltransferase
MADDVATYPGTELELFAGALHWKSYFSRSIGRWIRGDVLEVGAGIGSNTLLLQNPTVTSWHCLEQDELLASRLRAAVSGLPTCRVSVGTTATLPPAKYDTILYIDVLEHIEDDRAETRRAAALLREGGRLIVLAPAHQELYSQFDRAIGHYRRYDRTSLRACEPDGLRIEELYFLDCVGMLASLANRMLLKREQPRVAQIAAWDRYMIPVSKVLDLLTGRRPGRSIVAVWRRGDAPAA